MRVLIAIALCACATSRVAYGYQECNGNPHVRVLWDKSIIEVDGTFYQMKKESLGKKVQRLVGHNMTFVQSKGSDVLIRNGVSSHYSCEKHLNEKSGVLNAKIEPYTPNSFVAKSGPDPTDPESDIGSNSSPAGHGKGHGGHGGHGGGHGGHGKGN